MTCTITCLFPYLKISKRGSRNVQVSRAKQVTVSNHKGNQSWQFSSLISEKKNIPNGRKSGTLNLINLKTYYCCSLYVRLPQIESIQVDALNKLILGRNSTHPACLAFFFILIGWNTVMSRIECPSNNFLMFSENQHPWPHCGMYIITFKHKQISLKGKERQNLPVIPLSQRLAHGFHEVVEE